MPPLLQARRFYRDPVGFLDRARRQYGDCFRLRLWPVGDLVVLSNAEAVHDLLIGDPAGLRAGEATERVLPVLAGSVLCADGDAHRERRRLLTASLSARAVSAQEEFVRQAARHELASWPRQQPIQALPRLRLLALRVLARVLLGIDTDDRLRVLSRLLDELVSGPPVLATWQTPLRFVLGPAFARRRHRLDEFLRGLLARPAAGTVLSLLDESGTDEDSLLAELRALLIVGHETTACALAWSLEGLARHPCVGDRLRADRGYADAVARETLRLRPPVVDVVRHVADPISLAGVRMAAGTIVTASQLLVHRDPGLYSQPDRFRPERFLHSLPAVGAYFPFGGGTTRCLGAHLAMLELRSVLAEAAERYRITPVRPEPEHARLRGTALAPSRGAELVIEGAQP